MKPLVLKLDQIGWYDESLAGAKAFSLARLIQAGLAVPKGFCITTEAYRRFLHFCPAVDRLIMQMDQLEAGKRTEITQLAGEIRQRLASTNIPSVVDQACLAAWKKLGTTGRVAVRSSATTEDLPQASFAGQYESQLEVQGLAGLRAGIMACWISFFNERAVLYRVRQRVAHRHGLMAVIVQEMVTADCAGILFTEDPVACVKHRLVIEVSHGLGEKLVSGRVNPDRIIIDRESLQLVEQQRGSPMAEPGDRQGLDAAGWQRLAEEALNAERAWGVPLDMEWAMARGQLFWLQARPITTPAPATPEDRIVWSNVNVGEVFPDVMTPMSWSVLRQSISLLFRPLLKRFGINLEKEPWLGLVAGRVYANVSVFARILRRLPAPKRLDLTKAFGGTMNREVEAALGDDLASRQVGWGQKMLAALRLAGLFLGLAAHLGRRRAEACLKRVRRGMDRIANLNFSALPENELLTAVMRGGERNFGRGNPVYFAAAALGFSSFLAQLTRRWLQDEQGDLANQLLSGTGTMASAEAALDLYRLADWVLEHPIVAKALHLDENFDTVRERLERIETGRQFLKQWDQFMRQHGHHTRGEIDVFNARWFEQPNLVCGWLRNYISSFGANDFLETQKQREQARNQLLAGCRERLAGSFKRKAFDLILRKAREGLAFRENLKSEAVRWVGAMRRALQELGKRWERSGLLKHREDIFFLQLEEIEPVRMRLEGLDIKALVAARRADYESNLQLSPPPVVVGHYRPDPAPPMESLPGWELKGLAVSPGVATGPARVILRGDTVSEVLPGEILVAPYADPGWTPHFLTASGIVMDLGGLLSHGSIVAREYGIPAVVNVGHGTQWIHTGQTVQVDGVRGTVIIFPLKE